MNASNPVVTRAGHSSGMNTRVMMIHGVAPSITAASSSSLGNPRMKGGSTQTVNGMVNVIYDKVRLSRLLYRPNRRISSNMPDNTATAGNMEMARIANSSVPRPRNCTRPSAYAAVTPKNSDRATTDTDTSTELKMLVAKGCSRNTAM